MPDEFKSAGPLRRPSEPSLPVEAAGPKQRDIDIKNLRFYADMFRQHEWSTVVIHWGVFEQTLREIADRIAAVPALSADTPTTRNSEALASFTTYCRANPDHRFWQALRNWSKFDSIIGENSARGNETRSIDTFHLEGLDGVDVQPPADTRDPTVKESLTVQTGPSEPTCFTAELCEVCGGQGRVCADCTDTVNCGRTLAEARTKPCPKCRPAEPVREWTLLVKFDRAYKTPMKEQEARQWVDSFPHAYGLAWRFAAGPWQDADTSATQEPK